MNAKISIKKRIISVILTVVLAVSMLPLSVFAADGGEAEVTLANGSTINFNSYADVVGYANRNGVMLKLLSDVEVPISENPDDIPFITGEFTLDLNGKNINEVVVGSVALDEENEVIKGKPGTLTVTDSSSGGGGTIDYLTVNTGALTVAGGAINYMYAENYAAAVNVTGGTVEQFSLSDGNGEEISATISGGVFRKIYMGGGTLTVNDDYQGKMDLDVNGGTTNIVGGTFADLRLAIRFGDIHLTGGTFTKISTELKVGSSEYKEPTLASLLGDNCAFYGTDGGGIVNADVLTLENVRIIADHKHSYGSGGKCTGCGAPCPHGNVVNATGICNDCKTQLEAKVTYTGKSPVYYTSFREAIDSILHNQKEQVTVTLLNYKYDLGINPLYFSNNNNIKLDLNGHTMSGSDRIIVEGNSALTVANGKLDSKLTIEAAGGDVTVEKDCEGVGTIRVTDAESTLTVFGGDIGKLSLPYTDTESLKNVKLSGGYFESVSFPNAGGDTVAITDMLEVGYAFKDNKGILKTTPGGLVPYGLTVSAKTVLAELEVVKCEHGAVNEVKGYCNYCGKLYAAKITYKNGNVSYVESLDDWTLILAENGTVKLLQDADRCNVSRSMTFDLNGRHVNTLDLSADGTVTVKGSGSIVNLILGYNYNSDVKDTTLIIEKPTVGTVDVGYLAVKNSTKTKLNGWSFGEIKRYDGLTLSDLLADGYAFFDKSSGKPVYLSEKNTDPNADYYIDRHDHTFTANSDGRDECECGLVCDHTDINENGICESCKTQIYFAALTKADGTKQNYRSFTDAWAAAIENEGSTLKILDNVDLGKFYTNALSVASGTFTLDLNDFTLSADSNNGVINVSGSAKLTVKNGKIENTAAKGVATRSSAITINYGYAELENVELTGGSAYDGEQACSAFLGAGTLHITGSTFNGAFWVYPDALAKIELKITSATLNNGIVYKYDDNSNKDYDGLEGFFADGCMLFDESGKYIDLTSDAYWSVGTSSATFKYADKAIVKSHEHTFVDGICSECDYACPHNSGKNDREASYFEKAICSVCHSEYGNYAEDTTPPTGEIKIKERTWWQSLLNVISFGVFFKEEVTVEITADDDSYTQSGYDAAKHAVKIEYLISTKALSEEAVKASVFTEYSGAIDLSDEDQYVIYAKLTDHAGNVSYVSTDGFEIDRTIPVIENMTDGGHYDFCNQTYMKISDKNIDKVTMDGQEETLDSEGRLRLRATGMEQTVVVTDKAGNTLTVYVTGHTKHEIDETTLTCRYCGIKAAIQVTADGFTGYYATLGSALDAALYNEEGGKRENVVLTMLRDLLYEETGGKDNTLPVNSTSFTIDLNGFTLSGGFLFLGQGYSGTVTIMTSKPGGVFLRPAAIEGAEATLIMGEGLGDVDENSLSYINQYSGTLKVYHGKYHDLWITSNGEKTTELYGGSFQQVLVQTDGMTCADLLAPEHRYEGLSYAEAKAATKLTNATVVPCAHSTLDEDGYCADCGFRLILAVEAGGVSKNFQTFESAIHYAEANTGSTVKLLRDITIDETTAGSLLSGYSLVFGAGEYTLDLNGKTLNINNYYFNVYYGCIMTIIDSVGGGKVTDPGMGRIATDDYSKLTVTGGEFNVDIQISKRSSLLLKGGSFESIMAKREAGCTPFEFIADGYTFANSDGSGYANESKLEYQVGAYYITDVTVVPVPLTIDEQPTNLKFYLTSRVDDKYVKFVVATIEEWWGTQFRMTFEKEDGTVIKEAAATAYEKQQISFSAVNFKVSDSGSYRVKFDLKGYVLYSNTFNITVAECEHPGYDKNTHECTQCGCEIAAVIKNGKTTGYVTFADALAAAQTDENKGCTLIPLFDVNEAVAAKSGAFIIDATNITFTGKLNVSKGVDLTVIGGTVMGNVICAKGGKLTASGTAFEGAINCVGSGDFKNCIFTGAVSPKGSMKLNSCEINGALSVSGNAEAEKCTVRGTVTINNGGRLKSAGGTYGNIVEVKSGGTLEIISGTFENTLTAYEGSKLIISGGSYVKVNAEENVDFTLSGGEFTNVTVRGQLLIDCLAEGKALNDMNRDEIIDGRRGAAGPVQVVDHTHTCVWKTNTHEKLCGCGYVEATDTEAPVISGIENGKTYYGAAEFSVADANDFTVTVDGKEVRLTLGSYILEPDNEQHIITATDVAGNVSSVMVTVNMLYKVKLISGAGYTLKGEPLAGYGTDYTFTLEIADGYSKTDSFMVAVNGRPMQSDSGSYTVSNVTSDIFVTVFGVADITAPEVEVSIRGNKFKGFLNRITFGLFFKETQTVQITAADNGSGIKKVEYLLSETAFADKNAVTGDWTELTLDDGKTTFNIEPGRKAFVYVRVTDQSDNITVVNSDGVVVYTDAKAVTGAQTFTKNTDSDVVYKLNLNGNFVAKVYNGTEEIGAGSDYALLANGMLMLKNSYLRTLAAGEYTIRLTIKPMGEVYVDNSTNDAPANVVLKLIVEKKTPFHDHKESDGKIYDGKSIGMPTFNTDSKGALTFEYKKAGEDDTAYTTVAPKNVGKYTIRITTAETDTFKALSSTMVFEIQPREVTISDVKVADKVYDGTVDANITFTGTVNRLVNGDNVTIVSGRAAFADENVGTGKAVAFSEFSIEGDDAANYVLSAQPTSATASISAKELTIKDLKVKDKQYDGKNTAEIEGTPALVGLVDGDVLTLLCGTPTFDSVSVGRNIAVSFTKFELFGNSTTVGNYTLTQPTGITANIVEYVAAGNEYSVNSNDWINKDFVITAKNGYKLSRTNTADDEWSDTLSASDETEDGRLTFYVKNTETGVISAAVTESYKIDKTSPTGTVTLNGNPWWKAILNAITFNRFFKGDVNVKLTAKDEASGIKSVLYYKSDKQLTETEVRAITDWTDNTDFGIKAKDTDKFIIYVRIEDNAGNVAYIGSDGAIFDTTAPKITGVDNKKIYYVTKSVTIKETNFEFVTLNGEKVGQTFTLAGDKGATYVIRAVDKAGNVTEYTVYMKPISSITDAISGLTADNVKSSDKETISSVEGQILAIADAFDDGESTEDEWNKLTEAAAKCKALIKRIADIADETGRLVDNVNGYDIDKVTSENKADIEKLIADIDALLGGENLTDTEKAELEALKGTAQTLLERIAAAKSAAEGDEITAIGGITKDNVKSGDKEALKSAVKALEGALRDFDGNYTEEEQGDLETKLEAARAALAAIGNAEKAADEIGKLPSAGDAKLSDRSELDRVKKLIDSLTENERAMLGKEALGKVDALTERIQKLAKDVSSPKTGDTSNPAMWIALLFISGGVTVISKKKKRFVK